MYVYAFCNLAMSTKKAKVAHWWRNVQGAKECVTLAMDFVWGGQEGFPQEAMASELRTEG